MDLGHDRARLAVRLLRLLAGGQPVPRDRALDSACELGIDRAQAQGILDAWTERGDNGDIIGFGLTLNPTPHQMIIGGQRMWAWCGMDTLIFVHVLDTTAVIESSAPASGDVIRLTACPDGITGVDPATAVVTQRVLGPDEADLSTKAAIWGSFCHHNHFFPSPAQAQRWAAGRDDIAIPSLDDGFAAAREMAGALLRYEPADGSR